MSGDNSFEPENKLDKKGLVITGVLRWLNNLLILLFTEKIEIAK